MQMDWEESLSDDLMFADYLTDGDASPFDLAQASTIPVNEEPSCSVAQDLESSIDTPPPLKRQKAVRCQFKFHL